MEHRTRTLLQLVCSAVALLIVGGTATAQVNHGTYNGSTVDFVDVTETTQLATDPTDVAVLFGAPSTSGDQLSFDASAFTASASGASGFDPTQSLLSVDIVATALGTTIDIITIEEFGQSILSGPAGSGGTGTLVTISGSTTILEIGGVDVPDQPGPAINAVFDPNFFFGLPADDGTVNWSGVAVIDIASAVPNATRVRISLNNTIQAFSEAAGNDATIFKSGVTISVPEPGTFALIGLGLLGALASGRRRN